MDEMLDQRHQAESAKADLPEEIAVVIVAERLRKSTAEADEAQNRTRNRDQLEKAQTGEVEQRTRESEARTREVDHRVRVRWFLAIAGALALILGSSSAVPPPSGSDVAGWLWQLQVSHSLALEEMNGLNNEPKSQRATGEHLSSSLMQRKAEIAILKRLGKQLGVELEKRRITYHGSVMEVDGIAPDDSVFVEVFARVSPMKSGQLRKVSTDSLKLIALQASYPDARFVLAFADQTALKSLAGWQLAVLEHHKIERRVVEIPASLKQELLTAQANQKEGMAGRAGA